MKVEEIAADILNMLENKLGKQVDSEQVELVRLALGLTLTSIHAAMIHSAEIESRERAVERSLDTCQRLLASIKRNVEELGIEGFTFISSQDSSEPTSEEVH